MREMKDSGVEWIGEVPANWDMLRIYQLAFPVKNINEGMKEDNLLSLSYGNIVQKDINKVDGLVPASYEGYNIIEPGDIVLRFTDLQNDQRSLRTGLCNFDGIITSAYLTIRPRHELVSSKYLHYVLHFVDTLKVFYNMGGGMRQSLDWNGVSHMFLPIPSKPEQRRIVSYLDERCAAIDEDVAKRREVIEKLREYKKSLIARVVTKGLDPNAEMRDSSVEWIGEVPTDWNLSPLKSLYRLSKGLSITKADLAETGEPVISYGQIHAKWNPGTSIRSDLIRYVPNKIAASHPASRATAGSFIFADTSEDVEGCGNAAYVDEDRPVYGGYHTIIATPIANVCGKYFAYQFLTKAWRSQLIRQFVDVKLFSITQRALQQTSLIVPSYLEQEKIAAYLDERCAAIDEAISRQEQLIEKLGEYRKSVIHHAVTGKIDCTEA